MKRKLYASLRRHSIFSRVYYSSVMIGILPLVVMTEFFTIIYLFTSVANFEDREQSSLYYYSSQISNELYHFDNAVVTISQDAAVQDCLNRWLVMDEYERYVTTHELTQYTAEQLHMLDYVTDIVLVTNNYAVVQLCNGPHDDLDLQTLDYRGIVKQTFYQTTNTWICDAAAWQPADSACNQNGFFYAKRVTDSQNNVINIGYILAYIDKEAFFNLSPASRLGQSAQQQYIINPDGRIIHSSVLPTAQTQPLFAEFSRILSVRLAQDDHRFYLSRKNPNGSAAICMYYDMAPLEWYVAATIPLSVILTPVGYILALLLVLILILLFTQRFFSANVSYSIEAPLKEILSCLQRIESGDFTPDAQDPYADELAHVHNSLNYTAKLLDQLFQETKQNERDKYNLQYRALLSQMNPHFLMNSLNSVVLLAELQGAENIKNLCRAISSLCKDMLNGSEAAVPLAQELALLDDYILIMNYRYFDRFHVQRVIDVDPQRICIPRFTLQPLLENALMHGLGEQVIFLNVELSVQQENGRVVLRMRDDGRGITEQRLAELNAPDFLNREHSHNGRHIGLWNINRRIQLTYGENYGLRITGQQGCGACITITLPILTQGEEPA